MGHLSSPGRVKVTMPSPHRLGKLSAPFAVLGGVRVCVLWGERVGCMWWIDWPMKAVKCVAMMISCIVTSLSAAGDMPQAGTEGRSRPRTGRRDSLQSAAHREQIARSRGHTPLFASTHTTSQRPRGGMGDNDGRTAALAKWRWWFRACFTHPLSATPGPTRGVDCQGGLTIV